MNDPEVARVLREMEEQHRKLFARTKVLNERYGKLASEFESQQSELQQMKAAVSKAQKRIRYIEDIPGKRVPYFLNFSIDIPGPTDPSLTLAGTQLVDNKQVSMDGPFVCTSYMSAFLMRTYSQGPYGTAEDGRPNDPLAGTEVITPLSGRFRPVASTADPFAGAYIGARVGPITVAGAQAVQTFRPGEVDFLFEIQDNASNRNRQNQIPMPSRYIFSEFDRPLYLPVGDFFERGSTVTWKMTLTRDIGMAEVNWATLPTGFAEGELTPAPDPSIADGAGRLVVQLGGTVYFTMCGYKILQAESPAV
jgi:hypothetical protein